MRVSDNQASSTQRNDTECEPEQRKPLPKEWQPEKRWNPFNSYKLLAHVERWRTIKRGRPLPAPILITVDPSNACNLNCAWCNAEFIRSSRQGFLSEKTMLALADFLPHWGKDSNWDPGVKAVCVAGGGEPLLNPHTPAFLDRLAHNDIEIGVVTNGTQMHACVDALSQATWVGVSVDAGTAPTFSNLKGLPPDSDVFDKIITNIATLSDYARRHNYKLGWKHSAYGVSFKYLLYKENIGEMYTAAKLAKSAGCKNIHFRPASTSWDKIDSVEEIVFTAAEIAAYNEQISRILELDDDTFNVYGITHKFNSQFERCNFFLKCYAVFMTAVIEPSAGENAPRDSFMLGLCCDRRGDAKLELGRNIGDVREIQNLWGSEAHWRIHDEIVIRQECPRCTYQPHNEIYEQVILNDSMTHKFI